MYYYSTRKNVYSDDLLRVTSGFTEKIGDVKNNLGTDNKIVNQGLFLMTTALFEDAIREIMKIILLSLPEKLQSKSFKISRKDVCEIADSDEGHSVIIEKELYSIFSEGVKKQLENLLKILCNLEEKNITPELKEYIGRLNDISLYRNALIHNGGMASPALLDNARHYKISDKHKIDFNKKLIEQFIADYEHFFAYLEDKIKSTFQSIPRIDPHKRISIENISKIEKARLLWEDCFSSPLLKFEDYWDFDLDNDLITGIKYTQHENSLSSSEKVLLSIWRHQFNDSVKTEEFLVCSVDYEKIYRIYKGLDGIKFYHMMERSMSLRRIREKS